MQTKVSIACLWTVCPKEQYISLAETSFSVNLLFAYTTYSGTEYSMMNLFERAGLYFQNNSVQQWRQMDKERISDGDNATTEVRKERRKLKKRLKIKQQDAFQHIEGTHYQPQEFHTNAAH